MSGRTKRRLKEEEEDSELKPTVTASKKRATSKSRVVKATKLVPPPVPDPVVLDTSPGPGPELAEPTKVSSNIVSSTRVSKSSKVSSSRVSTSSRVSQSSRTPQPLLLLPERVTRSRSRSILRESPPPPSSTRKLRIDRLDIQSEDEEENEDEENISEKSVLVAIPEKVKSQMIDFPFVSGKWMSSKEGKGIVASIVLLFLLVLIHKLVGSMQSESLNEKMIVLLAYALSPVRGVVEGVRAVGGGGQAHTQRAVKEIDYDMLANRIINSDKFKQVIEKVSSEKIVNYDTQLELKIKKEVEQISMSIKDTQNMYTNLDVELTEAKTYFNTEIEKAASVLKVEIDKDSSLENTQKIGVLDGQIKDLRQKLEEINLQVLDDSKGSQNQISQELADMKTKLNDFEETKLQSAIEIQKCCKANADVNLVIENKLNAILNDDKFVLKQTLNDNFLKKQEFDQKLQTLTSEIEANLETHKEMILEETRKDIEITMNEKVTELKENFGNEFLNELQSSLQTNRKTNTSQDSLHSSGDVTRIVREALTKYDADKTGLFDFALETAGGSIVTTKCTEPYQMTSAVMSVWGVPFWWDTNSPRSILQPGSSPGQCWAFRGSHGVVVVQLSSPIYITAVTIEHISNLLSPDGNIYSAPSTLSLAGQEGEHLTPLLNFTYTKTGDPVQTFWVKEEKSRKRWQTVELTIHNNHGHPDYTCLYRFRVHGTVSQEQIKHH